MTRLFNNILALGHIILSVKNNPEHAVFRQFLCMCVCFGRVSHKLSFVNEFILDGFERGHAQRAQVMSSYDTHTVCVF